MNLSVALALQRAEFLSSPERFTVLAAAEDEAGLRRIDRGELSKLLGRQVRSRVWEPERLLARGDRDRIYLEKRRIAILPFDAPGYPPELREIYDPPLLIFAWGEPLTGSNRTPTAGEPSPGAHPGTPQFPLHPRHSPDLQPRTDAPGPLRAAFGEGALGRVAVVGTRRATEAAFAAAFRLGREGAEIGCTVVSGLAHGIDTAAHRGVVAGNGSTVAVLGSGIDVVYPYGNRALGRLILERGGTVVSEYPPGLSPMAHRFPERNRIISGLSRAVVVVEAPKSSGALITAEYGLEQGREVVVHIDGLSGLQGEGTAGLHSDGAPAISSLAELWPAHGNPTAEPVPPPGAAKPFDPSERDVSAEAFAGSERTGRAHSELRQAGRSLAEELRRELGGGIEL